VEYPKQKFVYATILDQSAHKLLHAAIIAPHLDLMLGVSRTPTLASFVQLSNWNHVLPVVGRTKSFGGIHETGAAT